MIVLYHVFFCFFFFFQAEDGIRDIGVTGVQTCALPICSPVEGAVAEHVPDGGEDRGGDGADGLLRAAAGPQAVELRLEVAGLPAGGGPGALHEGDLEPGGALAQPGRATLARALVAPGAEAGPGDEMGDR